jgi:hypothetical protein
MEDPMENKNSTTLSGKMLRKPALIAALLVTAVSLSACVVPVDRDRDGGRRHHHWNNDNNWNDGDGWQGNGGGSWNHHR